MQCYLLNTLTVLVCRLIESMMINWAQGILHTQRFRSRPFERWRTLSAGRRGKEAYLTTHDMTWHDMTLQTYIYIYIPGSSKGHKWLSVCKISALRADFLWRSWKWSFFDYCGQFWISYLLGWYYSTLRKNVSIFLGGNSREKGGNTRADSSWLKNENMKW